MFLLRVSRVPSVLGSVEVSINVVNNLLDVLKVNRNAIATSLEVVQVSPLSTVNSCVFELITHVVLLSPTLNMLLAGCYSRVFLNC